MLPRLLVIPAVLIAAISLGSCSPRALNAPTRGASRYAISTQGEAASRAAEAVLRDGGNLFDAAVAASFVISVERPHSTGIAGGGFWLSHHAATGKLVALDFRERAPSKIQLPRKLLKQNPEGITQLLQDTPLGAGTPGFVAGMGEVHRRYGRLPWARLIQPAIDLAEGGFTIYPDLAEALADRRDVLARDPDAARIFLHADGSPRKLGETLLQKDLAATLRLIAKDGADAFYRGDIARKIAAWMKTRGAALSAEDLRNYKVIERAPVVVDAFQRRIAVMPPPSSGGIHLPQMLRLLESEREDMRRWGASDERTLHRVAQAMQLAYADRARYLGDPDYTRVPQQLLLSREYLSERRKLSFGDRAIPAQSLTPLSPEAWRRLQTLLGEHTETTHLSFLDGDGNAIATTQSINGWMGSGQVVAGTGLLLNNTNDDFSIAEGVKNLYGAIGSKPNRLEPGKTPLSSMTPTIVFDPAAGSRPTMAIGAPGGTRIITCVLQTLLHRWVHGLPLAESIARPRIHQQWMPDELLIEDPAPRGGFSKSTTDALATRGHPVKRDEVHCRVLAAEWTETGFQAATDPRDVGLAIVR
jgi:gamma-glutamyltranspeptidase/glutathione hydrolase